MTRLAKKIYRITDSMNNCHQFVNPTNAVDCGFFFCRFFPFFNRISDFAHNSVRVDATHTRIHTPYLPSPSSLELKAGDTTIFYEDFRRHV